MVRLAEQSRAASLREALLDILSSNKVLFLTSPLCSLADQKDLPAPPFPLFFFCVIGVKAAHTDLQLSWLRLIHYFAVQNAIHCYKSQ